MDHLKKEYGNFPPIDVWCVTKEDSCHDSTWTFTEFHRFPEAANWTLEDDGILKPKPEAKNKKLAKLLQSWLFFGLIYTIIQKNGERLLKLHDLIREPHDLLQEPHKKLIDTSKLTGKLQEWADWETAPDRNVDDVQMRMIRIALVLDKARKVVRRYCSYAENERDMYSRDPENDSYMSDEAALSLMVLGETISAVNSKIMQKIEERVPRVAGWHSDDNSGWGQPLYAIMKMRQEGWCPRNVHLLKRQLGSQATMLLTAYFSHRNSTQLDKTRHKQCTTAICHVKSGSTTANGDESEYTTAHHDTTCPEDSRERKACEEAGPDGPEIRDVESILRQDDQSFPLLQFEDSNNSVKLKVIAGNKEEKYATISHVWSDGYGNETSNKLFKCQLRFIRRLLGKASGSQTIPFWMDTLVIPVGRTHTSAKAEKKKAIHQIHTLFKNSQYSIVLDKGLVNMSPGEPCQTAVKLLASGWMRRLWTLQEAFLSNKLKIAFHDQDDVNPLKDFEELRTQVQRQADIDTSVIASLVDDEMSHSIMWDDKAMLNEEQLGNNALWSRSTVVANSWRAARWRTTSNKIHETLALATLLDLQATQQSEDMITDAGIREWKKGVTASDDDRQELMKEFWMRIEDTCKGSIPAGMIFLPGKRMSLRGFGWAPLTFMTAEEVDHPDPLSVLSQPTKLDESGLYVKCPGFILNVDNTEENRKMLVKTEVGPQTGPSQTGFDFPVDRSFLDWYKVEPIPEAGDNKYAADILSRSSKLAIIISKPSPKENPPEIGLLVEIYKSENRVYYSQILFRVRIRRSRHRTGNSPDETHLKSDNGIFGQVVEPDQKWCVDGVVPERFRSDQDLNDTAGGGLMSRVTNIPNMVASMFAINRRFPIERHATGLEAGTRELPKLKKSFTESFI